MGSLVNGSVLLCAGALCIASSTYGSRRHSITLGGAQVLCCWYLLLLSLMMVTNSSSMPGSEQLSLGASAC